MKNKKLVIILILMIVLSIVAVAVGITINKIAQKEKQNEVSSELQLKTAEEKEQEEIAELKNMGEVKRMQFYVSKYFSYIEARDYENAYKLLYDEFKQNYFNTQEEFEMYIKNKYPDIITLNYENLERLGTYYVLTVSFSDLINNEKNFTQLFVVRENGFNDFVLSFQAE